MEDNTLRILNDHENRLRRLEESDAKQQIQLANIEKGLTEVKLLVNESTKEQYKNNQRQQDNLEKTITVMMDKMMTTIADTVNSKNQTKILDRKEIWGIVALIIGGIVTWALK